VKRVIALATLRVDCGIYVLVCLAHLCAPT